MSGVKLPELGRDLWMRPPLETTVTDLEDACQSSVGFGLSVRLRDIGTRGGTPPLFPIWDLRLAHDEALR